MTQDIPGAPLSESLIQEIILEAMKNLNQAREQDARLDISPDANIFGPGSPLDSMGLVALIMDIEELLGDKGYPVVLSDEKAVSRSKSPFRSVPSLVSYISGLAALRQ